MKITWNLIPPETVIFTADGISHEVTITTFVENHAHGLRSERLLAQAMERERLRTKKATARAMKEIENLRRKSDLGVGARLAKN